MIKDYFISFFNFLLYSTTHILTVFNQAIFGLNNKTILLKQSLLAGMAAIKMVILVSWKSLTTPSLERWLIKMLLIIQMDRLHYREIEAQICFFKTLGSFLSNIKCI